MTDQIKLPTKAEWIAALRSGVYKQLRNGLMNADSHCCLAVYLVEAHKMNASDSKVHPSISDVHKLHPEITIAKMIRMNDVEKKSFNEIADYLESLP